MFSSSSCSGSFIQLPLSRISLTASKNAADPLWGITFTAADASGWCQIAALPACSKIRLTQKWPRHGKKGNFRFIQQLFQCHRIAIVANQDNRSRDIFSNLHCIVCIETGSFITCLPYSVTSADLNTINAKLVETPAGCFTLSKSSFTFGKI